MTIFRVKVAYKCNACGKVEIVGSSMDMSKEEMKSFCKDVIKNQAFEGNPYLHQAPKEVLHICDDGSVGIATFAGVLRVDK